MTARSGADSGNDDKEEDGPTGVWGCCPSGVHGQRGMKLPTIEYFYFSDSQFCLHFSHIIAINNNQKACICEGIATQRPLRLRTSRSGILSAFSGFFLFENIAFWEVPCGNHKCRSRGATLLVNNKLESVLLRKHYISTAERYRARRSGIFFGLVWFENIVFGRFEKCAWQRVHVEQIRLLYAMRMRIDALTG